MQLAVCSDCHRHVRVNEAACAFCGGVSSSPVPVPRVRGSRAALFAAALAATVDCGARTDIGEPPDHDSDAQCDVMAPVTAYGLVFRDAGACK